MIDGGVDAKRVVAAEEVETAVSRLHYYGLINVHVSCRKGLNFEYCLHR